MPRFATVNIRNLPDMPRQFVREDAATSAGLVDDIIGLQEIGELEDHADVLTGLNTGLGEALWKLCLGGLEPQRCDGPIAYNSAEWQLEETGNFKLHDGRAKMSVDRIAVWGNFRRLDRPDLPVIRVVNVHFVANTWGPGDDQKPDHELRKATWNQDFERTREHCVEVASWGRPVVLVGDFNRRAQSLPWLPTDGARLARTGGIEHIWVFDTKDFRWRIGRGGTFDLHSDHNGEWVNLGLPRPPKPPPPPKPHPCPHVLDDGRVCGFEHFAPA